jgi:hypothetical protein
MMNAFKLYKPREVRFDSLRNQADWSVKVYTITTRPSFEAKEVLENAVARLSEWLDKSKMSGMPTYGVAFLIVHEGRDGIWSLINWWMGGEVLQSMTFFTPFGCPNVFEKPPAEGFMSCVWEQAVIFFERSQWVEFVLKKAEKPDIKSYLNVHLNAEV